MKPSHIFTKRVMNRLGVFATIMCVLMLAGAFLYMSNPSDATQRLLIVGVIIFLIIFIPLVIGLIISMIETARRNRRKEG